jgi:EmrB/QacA subfamily drug resistance transporter
MPLAGAVRQPCDKLVAAADAKRPAPCTRPAEAWILAATILASGMAFIDGTVVNVALPALQTSLGATLADGQWIIEGYELMLGALLLLGGAAGDRFGRRRVFALGVVLFTLASVACGLSRGVVVLIAARCIQGIGGALLVPGSLALLSASFPEERRGRAIGTWSAFTAMTGAFGPVLGGFLIDHASWRYAFFLNVPIALAVLVISFRWVPDGRGSGAETPIDWVGALLAAPGLGGIVYALIASQSDGWHDPAVLGPLAGGVIALVAFLVVESRQEAPMLPLGMFRSRDFAGANLLTLLLYGALGGSLFFFPLDLIQVQGYSSAAAGAALLPLILIMFALSRWAGALVERHGPKGLLVAGPIIAAGGFALFAIPGVGGSYWTTFFPAALVLGLGITLTAAPLTTTVMQSTPAEALGAASGVNNDVSTIAGLLAVAGFGIVMSLGFNAELNRRLATADIPAAVVASVELQRAKLAAIPLDSVAQPELRVAVGRAIDWAFVAGFRRVMVIAAALAALSAAAAWLMIGGRALRRDVPN